MSRTRGADGQTPSAWSMKGALSFVGAPALLTSLGGSAGLSLIAWLLGGGRELEESVKKGRIKSRRTNMIQGLKTIITGTGEIYLYSDVRVTASAVWGCCIVLVRGVIGIGSHHIACDPVMVVIKPMKPTAERSGPG
jgi:hypothetical protein